MNQIEGHVQPQDGTLETGIQELDDNLDVCCVEQLNVSCSLECSQKFESVIS